MTKEVKSPFSDKIYHIFEVSPTIYNLMNRNEKRDDSEVLQLQIKITELSEDLKKDAKLIKSVSEQQKKEITDIMSIKTKKLEEYQYKLIALNQLEPETVARILRTFVEECETMLDKTILRMGKDVDYLWVSIQNTINEDSNLYSKAMDELFRHQRRKSDSNSSKGERV